MYLSRSEFETFFKAEAPWLAEACHEMSRRFMAGGRLLAFGCGSSVPLNSSVRLSRERGAGLHLRREGQGSHQGTGG